MSQATFTKALLDPAQPEPEGLQDGFGNPAGRRFSVYCNNVTVSLIEALEAGFPAIRKLIGEENFTNIAHEYLRREPPASAVMMLYGAGFADFLEGFEPLSKYGYLPDVARLEYLLRESYHAADAPVITPQALAEIPTQNLGQVRLVLSPSTRCLVSQWPVFSLWAYNTQANAAKPAARAESVLITRPEFDPAPHLLPAGGQAFVRALQAKNTLEQSATQAAELNSEFDLSTALSTLLNAQAISRIDFKEAP